MNFNTNTTNNETWLTPPEIISSLGEFDLDPCTPDFQPWETAKKRYTKNDDGLISPWEGRVWLNPPYGRQLIHWMNKMSLHKNGTALIFGRTDTQAFHKYIFPFAESILFIEGRLKFYDVNGNKSGSANAPSVLIGYDEYNSERIEQSLSDKILKGFHQYLGSKFIVVGIHKSDDRTWKIIVGEAIVCMGRKAELTSIYQKVVDISPSRVRKNKHYKAKIRQTLQFFYEKEDGRWVA